MKTRWKQYSVNTFVNVSVVQHITDRPSRDAIKLTDTIYYIPRKTSGGKTFYLREDNENFNLDMISGHNKSIDRDTVYLMEPPHYKYLEYERAVAISLKKLI